MNRQWTMWAALALLMAGAPATATETTQAVRARIKPMTASSPAELSDAQLQAFGDAVGNARVVALGEQTHGGLQEFQVRQRLLRYLHEQKGFDVLLIESGIFDTALLQDALRRGEKLDTLSPGNIFYMYSRTDAGRELMRYVDDAQAGPRPLRLSGIDSQLSGAYSRAQLLTRLHAQLTGDATDWPVFERVADRLMQMDRTAPPPAEQQVFDSTATRLRKTLCAAGASNDQGLLCRSLDGLQAQAAGFWRGDYQRDRAMADNVLWQLKHVHPGRKVVLWGHIIHLARGVKFDDTHRFAGDILGEKLGRDYFVVNTTALQGSYLDFVSGEVQPIAAAYPNSLELAFASHDAPFAFLHAPKRMDAGFSARSTEFSFGLPLGGGVGLGAQWDGTFYVRDMAPVKMVR